MMKKMVSLLACAALLLAFSTAFALNYNKLDLNEIYGHLATYNGVQFLSTTEDGIFVNTRDGSEANKNAIINYLKQFGCAKSRIEITTEAPYWEDDLELWEMDQDISNTITAVRDGHMKVYTSFPGEYNSAKKDVAAIFENCRLWSFEERYLSSGRAIFVVTTDDATMANTNKMRAIIESWGHTLGYSSTTDILSIHYRIQECRDLIGLTKYNHHILGIQTIKEANVNGNPRGVTVGTSNMSQQNQAEIVKELRKRGYDKNAIEIHYVPEGTANIALTDSAAAPPQQNFGTDTLPPTGDASLPAAPFILLGLSAAAGIAAMAKRRRLAK